VCEREEMGAALIPALIPLLFQKGGEDGREQRLEPCCGFPLFCQGWEACVVGWVGMGLGGQRELLRGRICGEKRRGGSVLGAAGDDGAG